MGEYVNESITVILLSVILFNVILFNVILFNSTMRRKRPMRK